MPQDNKTAREEDIRAISRRLTREGRPMKDRMIYDERGRRILYDTDKKNRVRIREYDESAPSERIGR